MSVHVRIVKQLYDHVINDVIDNVREHFIEDGVGNDLLNDLKEMWLRKVKTNRVVNPVDAADSTSSATPLAEEYVSIPITFNTADSTSKVFDLNLPASALKDSSYSAKLMHALGTEEVNSILRMTITTEEKRILLQSIVNKCWSADRVIQLDGPHSDDSETEDEYEDDEDEDNEENEDELDDSDVKIKEEVTGEEYDLSEDDDGGLAEDEFAETDNIIACQYESVRREKNLWRIHLKKGVMNIDGQDFIFDKMIGDATW